jgi:hypothetical protein
LADIPDYGMAPVSSLDGCHFRPAYLLITNALQTSYRESKLANLIRSMMQKGNFVSVYPLEPWLGERADLRPHIPDEIEVVAGRCRARLEEFCRLRPNIYQGVILLADLEQYDDDVRNIRDWLPGVPVVTDTEP